MSGKLPLSVNLVEGETPASLAVRLGRKNGSEYAADFCLDRGFRLQDVADGRAQALSSLAVLGGESLINLKRFSVERIGETQYSAVFNAEDVDPIVVRFKGSVCQLAARRRVNAPRAQFDVLLKAGFIVPIGGAGDARPSYDPEGIDHFPTSLQESTTPVDADNEHCVDIQTACRKTVTGAAETAQFLLAPSP